MKELAPMLQQLAQQLGTTVEFLWAALMRQALIDGVVTLVQFVIIGVGLWANYKYTRFVLRKINAEDHKERWDEPAIIPPTILWVVLAILTLVAFFSISDLLAAFFNPEYWALQKVLSFVK